MPLDMFGCVTSKQLHRISETAFRADPLMENPFSLISKNAIYFFKPGMLTNT